MSIGEIGVAERELDQALAEQSPDAPISAEARRENPARGIMIAAPAALILWAIVWAIYRFWLPFIGG